MSNLGMDVTLVPAGTVVTATGNGASYRADNKSQFRGISSVSAAAGTTPGITVKVQTSHDDGVTDAWRDVAAFAAQTAAGDTAWKNFGPIDRYIRAAWTVTGTTPSITFGVPGEVL